MITVNGYVACEQWSSGSTGGEPSGCTLAPFEMQFDPTKITDGVNLVDLALAFGYVTDVERKHFYCPRHDPAAAGTVHEIMNEWVEVAPGVMVRAGKPTLWRFLAEVKTEQAPTPKRWEINAEIEPDGTRLALWAVYDDADFGRARDLILHAFGTAELQGPAE